MFNHCLLAFPNVCICGPSSCYKIYAEEDMIMPESWYMLFLREYLPSIIVFVEEDRNCNGQQIHL